MSRLTLRYQFDADPDDSFGWLGVTVETADFSGRGGFWVQWQDIEDFGRSLTTYPIPTENPLERAWGYEPWEGDTLIVRIEIAPANLTGELRIRVELGDPDPDDRWPRVRASFLTNYSELEPFRIGIEKLIARQTDEAVLLGH